MAGLFAPPHGGVNRALCRGVTINDQTGDPERLHSNRAGPAYAIIKS
jgi:hypothetical protein